jgi:hypothetical protein
MDITSIVVVFGIGMATGMFSAAAIIRMAIAVFIADYKSLTSVADAQVATIERQRETIERLNDQARAAARATATA